MLRLFATPKTRPVFPAKTCCRITVPTIRRISARQSRLMEWRVSSRASLSAAAEDSRLYTSARDRMASANAGEHFPKRVKHAIHRCFHRIEVAIVDVLRKHLALGGRMLAIGFDMDAEVSIMLGIIKAVMLLQSVDLRFTDWWNLTLICIERGQSFRGRSL